MTFNNIYLLFSGSPEETKLSSSIINIRDISIDQEEIDWPFDQENIDAISDWFTCYGINSKPPIELGTKLYNLLFSKDVQEQLGSIFEKSVGDNDVNIFIKPNSQPLLNKIPYEILHDGKSFLFSQNRVVIRSVVDKSNINPILDNFKKYLFIFSEPTDGASWNQNNFAAEIKSFLVLHNVKHTILTHTTTELLENEIIQDRKATEKYDAIFVIAHGCQPKDDEDGFLILENEFNQSCNYPSSSFASLLCEHQGCFVFLCSCWSGNVNPNNPLASIGYRLIFGGPAGSVLAMQRPITIKLGKEFVKTFIKHIIDGQNIYKAYHNCSLSWLGKKEHGVPCLISKPIKMENSIISIGNSVDLQNSIQLRSVLSIENQSKIAFILPGFRMGMKNKSKNSFLNSLLLRTQNAISYAGVTSAKTDINAIKEVIMLLGKFYTPRDFDNHVLIDTDENLRPLLEDLSISHYFFLGSNSLSLSKELLEKYSDDFTFEYKSEYWSLLDQRTKRKYDSKNPIDPKSSEINYKDYAIIEKIINKETKKVIFFIAGARDSSTLAAGKYFTSHLDEIYHKFGNGGFQYILEMDTQLGNYPKVIVERSPKAI